MLEREKNVVKTGSVQVLRFEALQSSKNETKLLHSDMFQLSDVKKKRVNMNQCKKNISDLVTSECQKKTVSSADSELNLHYSEIAIYLYSVCSVRAVTSP